MAIETTELSNCYRVTDLPQLTDLNNQDLFLISHVKDQYGNYESQSIPFRRLMNAVKRRGFKDEIALLNELNETALRENDLSSYAKKQEVTEMGEAAKTYIDGEIAKIHTHANKAILDQISTLNVSQFANDVGYLSAHQSLAGYATESWVEGKGYLTEHQSLSDLATKAELAAEQTARSDGDSDTLSAAKEYTDTEVAKIHTHANKAILDQIEDMHVSQWQNDAGYLDSDDIDFQYHDGKIWLSAGIKEMSVDAAAFIKDGMVQNVSYSAKTKKLTVTFNTDAGKEPIEIDMSDLVDVYAAGDGLTETNKQFSINWNLAASKSWVGDQGFQKKTVFRDWTED